MFKKKLVNNHADENSNKRSENIIIESVKTEQAKTM